MTNPSQPELRRSERGATVEQSAKATASRSAGAADNALPDHATPEANRPGAEHPSDGHQPDLDRFAERLGLTSDADDDDNGGVN